ncbi:MAG: ATP-binding protein [Waterburya sp.]
MFNLIITWYNLLKVLKKIEQNIYLYSFFTIIIPLSLAQLLRFLQPAETINYDLLFYLNPGKINERHLIYPLPVWWSSLLLIFPVLYIAKIVKNFFYSNLSLIKLQLTTGLYGLFFIVILALISYWGFKVVDLWISVTPAMIGVCLSWIVLNNYCRFQKQKRDLDYLQRLLKDFKHNIGSISTHISRSNRAIIKANNSLTEELIQDSEDLGQNHDDFIESFLGKNTNSINVETQDINSEIQRIKYYQNRTSNFLKYTYSNQISKTQKVNFNNLVNQTIVNYLENRNYDYHLDLQTEYDYKIENQTVYPEDIAIILENLIDNALYAIDPKFHPLEKNYIPQIKIKTINKLRFVQIIIEDNGVGISTEKQKEVFLPFVSCRNSTGFGLYLVEQIVNSLNGSINLKSQIWQGTRFIISIPKLWY